MDDVQLIHWVARRVAAMAADLHDESGKVLTRDTAHWQGRSAARYRGELADRAADYRRLSGDLDRLHSTLLSHARHVQDHEAVARSLLGPLELPAHLLSGGLL